MDASGCAPDTILGAGIQTSLKAFADGWIGRPVAAFASVTRAAMKDGTQILRFIISMGVVHT